MRLKKQVRDLEKRVAALEVEAQKRHSVISYSVKVTDRHANDLIVKHDEVRHIHDAVFSLNRDIG